MCEFMCVYVICQMRQLSLSLCVWPCVSVNLLHVVCVSVGESPTVKLMKRATGQVWCGTWSHGSVDMCNSFIWLSGIVLREIRAAAQAEVGCCRQRVVCMFSLLFKSKIDVRKSNKCAKCAGIESFLGLWLIYVLCNCVSVCRHVSVYVHVTGFKFVL